MALDPSAFQSLRELSAAALFGVTLAACTFDKDLASTNDTSSSATEPAGTTTGPETGTTEPEGPTTTGTTGEDDFGEMLKCMLPAVCEPFTHNFAEGSPYHSNDEPILPGEMCLWTELRDGTPGWYTYTTDHTFGNGHETWTYLIHVHEGRKVTFAGTYQGSSEEGGDGGVSSGFKAAVTCTLAEPAFFDDCLTNLDPFGNHFDCAWTDKWWVDCVEEGPKCE